MSLVTTALTAAVKARALELRFDRVAIGPATPTHGAAFERWLDAGYAASMDYLPRTRAERLEPARLLPGVRSVVAVAASYAPAPGTHDDGWDPVARYARGADYHDVMRPRLRALCEFIEEAAGPGVSSRASVDTSAVLERDLAAGAGLGWIGKNTNVLVPGLGSYVLIGIVLTTATLDFDTALPDRCGTCTACLDACPTAAFPAPYVLDARRCISYLTIEHRGDVDEDLRPRLGGWVFGCDVCQEVCPWNRKPWPGRDPSFAPSAGFPALETVLALDDAGFRARFRGSAVKRAKRAGLARNAALGLGTRRVATAVPALARALDDVDGIVRRAAAWALARIGSSGSR